MNLREFYLTVYMKHAALMNDTTRNMLVYGFPDLDCCDTMHLKRLNVFNNHRFWENQTLFQGFFRKTLEHKEKSSISPREISYYTRFFNWVARKAVMLE